MEQDNLKYFDQQDLTFLSNWTSVSDKEKLKYHILKLWQILRKNQHMYRCIERFMFLDPRLKLHFAYADLIESIKPFDSEKKVCDLGCCFGQDIRQLILEGVNPKSIYAIDLHDGYWNAGRELFMDTLESSSNRLNGVITVFSDFAQTFPLNENISDRIADSLIGNFNALICQMIFHVLTFDQTENIVKRMFALLKKDGILIGSCVGTHGDATTWGVTPRGEGVRFLQSKKSLEELLMKFGFGKIIIKEKISSEKKENNESDKKEGQKVRLEFVAFKI